VEGGAPDTWSLRLEPKQKQRDYDWLVLEVDRESFQIRGLTAADQQGGRSTFVFTNYRENTGIPDSAFDFKIPKGTDVIKTGSGRSSLLRRDSRDGGRSGSGRLRLVRRHAPGPRSGARAGLRPGRDRIHEDRAREPRKYGCAPGTVASQAARRRSTHRQ